MMSVEVPVIGRRSMSIEMPTNAGRRSMSVEQPYNPARRSISTEMLNSKRPGRSSLTLKRSTNEWYTILPILIPSWSLVCLTPGPLRPVR